MKNYCDGAAAGELVISVANLTIYIGNGGNEGPSFLSFFQNEWIAIIMNAQFQSEFNRRVSDTRTTNLWFDFIRQLVTDWCHRKAMQKQLGDWVQPNLSSWLLSRAGWILWFRFNSLNWTPFIQLARRRINHGVLLLQQQRQHHFIYIQAS